MLVYFLSLLWITIELFALWYACRAFLPLRHSAGKTALLFCAAALFLAFLNTVSLPLFQSWPVVRKLISLAVCYVLALFSFVWPWYGQLLIISLYYFILGAVDTVMLYGASALLGISVTALTWKKWLYVVVVTLGKSLTLLAAFFLYDFRRNRSVKKIGTGRTLRMTLFPLVSILLLYVTFDRFRSQEDLSVGAVVFSMVLVAANAAMLVTLRHMEKTYQTEQELALLNRSMALQSENILSLEQSYRAQRSAVHEYRHQLQTIADLLAEGENAEARKYISELQEKQSSRIFAVNTHHPIVDVILNEKYRLAKEKDIDIRFQVNDLSALKLPTDKLVVLLTNVLDNAVEGCERVPENRRIECSLLLEENLYFSVVNSSLPVEIRDGKSIRTSKKPYSEHGYGLPAVRHVLEELHGEFAVEYRDGLFHFAAEIPLQLEHDSLA